MTEKELIQQLKTLKNIKPSKEWAILRKQEIMESQGPFPSPPNEARTAVRAERRISSWFTRVSQPFPDILSNAFFKPAFATIACFGLVFSVFGYAQSALPGDAFYPAKKITEKIQFNLVSENEKPSAQISMTNKKIKELNQVVQANLGKNLAPAIQEVEQSAQETAKTLAKLTESVKVNRIAEKAEKASLPVDSAENAEIGQEQTAFVLTDTEDTIKIKETLAQIQEIKSVKQEVETHGVIVEMAELDQIEQDCWQILVEMEIERMESQILTEQQETLLSEIQELVAQEQYQQALGKFLIGQ